MNNIDTFLIAQAQVQQRERFREPTTNQARFIVLMQFNNLRNRPGNTEEVMTTFLPQVQGVL